jgi:hypothetical protein
MEDPHNPRRSPADDWVEGFHSTREGDEIRLEDMTDKHLQNTINFFKDKLDTTPLEEELASRQ